jgi:hypothetical protein
MNTQIGNAEWIGNSDPILELSTPIATVMHS